MTSRKDQVIPLLPPRRLLFRENGTAKWKQYHFTILGHKKLLGLARSSRPMHLLLSTNIDGFRSTEVVGLDLFSAVASAMLTAESIIIMLQRTGEIQLREDSAFDVASDSVFFGSRIQKLQETFGRHASESEDSGSGDEPWMRG